MGGANSPGPSHGLGGRKGESRNLPPPPVNHDGSMGRICIFTDPWMVDFDGRHVIIYSINICFVM